MDPIVWDRAAAAHLYRRAAFGTTPEDLVRALDEGLEGTVDRLLDFEAVDDSALDQRLASFDLETIGGLVGWWLTRMIFTRRPLEERLTWFLHDHFATSYGKVQDTGWMLQQNQLLRRFALGNFTELTIEISRDPAMLVWLDNFLNRKEKPNENFGRELLELFTLGHGNFSEEDVSASVRAFTGWTISRQRRTFLFVDAFHDHGSKTFLGRTGDWNGDDIVRFACAEPAHGRLIAGKLFEFLGHANPDHHLVDHLAGAYLEAGTSLRTLVREILTSSAFYSEASIRSSVLSPVEYLVGTIRQLEINADVTRFALGVLRTQGQVPFFPPDVDGWPAGMAWINSGSLLSRMNFAALVTSSADPVVLLERSADTPAELVESLLKRLGPFDVPEATRRELENYVSAEGSLPAGAELTTKMKGLTHLILSLPEAQMS
ncbi:MAG TPA: DUF1800 domain-containing protein [Thermoanaerobaculia bacterium]|nr:DUF1800 domain-containing protein [Thermoanaerobaculia bacterium]